MVACVWHDVAWPLGTYLVLAGGAIWTCWPLRRRTR